MKPKKCREPSRTGQNRITTGAPRARADGNIHRVPGDQWRKWGSVARYVFNSTYEKMRERQAYFLHPQQLPASPKHWLTTAWNAAWEAADFAHEAPA